MQFAELMMEEPKILFPKVLTVLQFNSSFCIVNV